MEQELKVNQFWQDHFTQNYEEIYKDKILGVEKELKYFVKLGVFSPQIAIDTRKNAMALSKILNPSDKILEIGGGTGYISLYLKLCGFEDIVVTDINPQAVLNIQANCALNNVQLEILLSDMFGGLDERKYDVIFWNHPYNDRQPPTINVGSNIPEGMVKNFLKAGFDPGYEALRRFFAGGKKRLIDNGSLYLLTSNIANLEKIKKMASDDYVLECVYEEEINQKTSSEVLYHEIFIIRFQLKNKPCP